MENKELKKILSLYEMWAGKPAMRAELLPASGSYRKYFRIYSDDPTVIGATNEDVAENEAFFAFSYHFHECGLPVPEIKKIDDDRRSYLLQDLGDETLFDRLKGKNKNEFPENLISVYKKVLDFLLQFQIKGNKGLDYSKCYPRAAFDSQSMMWDLNYFKYYFLKLAKVPFDEQKLEDDFQKFIIFLSDADSGFFMYRDFQSRNIMLINDEPWFIDYQGGRKGPLQYDLASLLYDGKAGIPPDIRNLLLDYYLDKLQDYKKTDREKFISLFNGFVLIRILQAMGAYGFRGYYENKPHFLQSIPFAVRNLEYLLYEGLFPDGLPHLRKAVETIIDNPSFRDHNIPEGRLTVTIRSFSYKKGLPVSDSGHGGGFVFDCRALPNPGRYEAYQSLSGKDKEVIDFLLKETSVDEFLNHIFALVDQSVREYIARDFSSLTVDFGCTGGQHRSVYCAEKLAAHLKEKFNINIRIEHTEKENWKK